MPGLLPGPLHPPLRAQQPAQPRRRRRRTMFAVCGLLLTYCNNLVPLGGSPVSDPFQDDGERERSDHVRGDTAISRR